MSGSRENVRTPSARLCSVAGDLFEPEDAVRLRAKTALTLLEPLVRWLINWRARTDDQMPPSWKTIVALKRRRVLHESVSVLHRLWGHIKDTQERVCVLVSLGGKWAGHERSFDWTCQHFRQRPPANPRMARIIDVMLQS